MKVRLTMLKENKITHLKQYCFDSCINRFLQRSNISKFKATNYGYIFNWWTHYITIYNSRIFIYDDNFIKVVVKVNRNYSAPYQVTYYFDNKGREIKAGNTRTELAIWKRKRKEDKNND